MQDLLESPALVVDPAAFAFVVGVFVGPVNQAALFVPLEVTGHGNSFSDLDVEESGCHVNVVRNQERSTILLLNNEALVLVTLGVIGKNPYYGSFNRRHSTRWSGLIINDSRIQLQARGRGAPDNVILARIHEDIFFPRVLLIVKFAIAAVLRHELRMRSALDHLTFFQDQNLIRAADG